LKIDADQAKRLVYHSHGDLAAAPASGTWRFEAMIVAPCSMKTVGALASGLADNLLARAGDVSMKEGRPLVLVVRETPLNAIHLGNMLRLAEAGAAILPACPAFYHRPQGIEDLVRYVVGKVLDRLGLELPGAVRWGEENP
jgi:4-hydroxy-3-polyprenylbenzoate decarboxylase